MQDTVVRLERPAGQGESTRTADRPLLSLTLGDTNGIGPEVVLKALADPRLLALCVPVIYGSQKLLKRYRKAIGDTTEEVQLHHITSLDQVNPRKINLLGAWEEDYEVTPGKPTPASGMAAYQGLARAVADAKAGRLHALVTAPIAKANMPEAFAATGHTDYLARELGSGKSLMVMATEALRVALVTDHIPLKDVPRALTAQRIQDRLDMFIQSLRADFGAPHPRIAVLGLNPHAGESGTMGREEVDIITPLLEKARQKLPTLLGPFPADAFFGRHLYRKFDGVLALYHDQGLIPFKALAGGEGVNFTAGLPIVRTSPAHGTAFDIAGKNQAEPNSTLAAIWCALDVLRNRRQAPVPAPKLEKIPKPLP